VLLAGAGQQRAAVQGASGSALRSRERRTPSRRFRALALATVVTTLASFLVLAFGPVEAAQATPTPTCGDPGTPSVLALHDPNFYIDSGQGNALFSAYAGYTVQAGSSAENGLWIKLSNFTGGVIGLASGEASSQPLPDIASNASSSRFFLLSADQNLATGGTTTAQAHTITLYRGAPGLGGSAVCTRTFSYSSVSETIKALANKVASISTSAPLNGVTSIGASVDVTVQGHTGQLGAGPNNDPGVLDLAPNALSDFPASAWRLERSEITISPDGVAPATTYVNRLYLSGASGADRPYTAVYRFRAVGPTAVAGAVKPIQYIASGIQVKHTDLGSIPLQTLPTVSSTGDITVTKSASPSQLGVGGGTAAYTVTLTNSSTEDRAVDAVVDTLPSGGSYVAHSIRVDGKAATEPDLPSGELVVRGPLTVPASGTLAVAYSLNLDATVGSRVNSVVAKYANVDYDGSASVVQSNPATSTVVVAGAGAGPSAQDDTATTTSNTPVSIPVLANDHDPSHLTLSIGSTSAPSNGTAIVSGSDIVYSPSSSFAGKDTFTYTITNGTQTASATVTVYVSPAAFNDAYAAHRGGTVTTTAPGVMSNDVCPSCTVTLDSNVAAGTLTLNADGSFTYTPPNTNQSNGTTGTFTFTYHVTLPAPVGGFPGGFTNTAAATVTLTLAEVAPDYATTPYHTPVAINVSANDNGGRANSTATAPTNGTVTLPSGGSCGTCTVTYSPNATVGSGGTPPPFWGIDTFAYSSTGGSGNATVTVLVGPPSLSWTVAGGATTTGSLATNVGTLSFTAATAPTKGTLTLSGNGDYTYTANSLAAGTDSFTYSVRHSTGLTITGTVNITIGPSAVNDSYSVVRGQTLTVNAGSGVLANDNCPATCTLAKLTSPAQGTATLNTSTGALTYSGATSAGTVTFNYRVSSSTAPSVTADATVTITIKELPTAVNDTAETRSGIPIDIRPLDNDNCPTACSITNQASLTSPSPSGTATLGTGSVVTYTPADGFSGVATFQYTLTDGNGSTSTATVSVTVDAVPAPPTLVGDAASTAAASAATIDVAANDTCAGCILEIASDPSNGSAVVRLDGRITYIPAAGFTGIDTFRYRGTSNTGGTDTATVTVSVTPTAADDSVWTAVGVPVAIDVQRNDACTSCTVAVVGGSGPDHGGTHVNGDGTITYAPDALYNGTDAFDYTVTDARTGSVQAHVSILVSNAQPDEATTAYQSAMAPLNVLANDVCAGCTVSSVANASSGTPSVAGASAVGFTPANGFVGLATFTYTAANGDTSVTGTVTVLVGPPNRTITLSSLYHGNVFTGPTSTPNAPALTSSCDGCTVTELTAPDEGDVDAIDGSTGGYTYTPPGGFTGSDSGLTYRITHGDLSVRGEVTFDTVTGPAAVDDVYSSLVGTVTKDAVHGVLANDTGTSVSVTSTTNAAHGSVSVDSDGSFTYTADDGFFGTDSFDYTITDSYGTSATATVTIQIAAGTANLSVTKTDDTASVVAGGTTSYSVVVSNAGPSDVTDASLTDTAPTGMTIGAWTCGSAGGATCPFADGTGNLALTNLSVPSGGSLTFTVAARIASDFGGATIANTATVASKSMQDNAPSDNSATDTDTVTKSADLSVTNSDGAASVVAGGPTSYSVVMSNNGPSDVTDGQLTDIAPAGMTIGAWTCAAAGGATCPADGSGNLALTNLALPYGGSLTFTVAATVASDFGGTTITNTASVASSASDPDVGNNSATATDTVTKSGDLAVTNTDGATSVDAGGTTSYTIVMSNNGQSDVTDGRLTDTAPAGMTIGAWTCAAAGGATCPADGSGNLALTNLSLPSGGALTFTVAARIASDFGGTTITNTATVSAPSVTEANSDNNSATDTDTVTKSADLAVTNTDGATSVDAGGTTSYTIVMSNNGRSDVTDGQLTDRAPAGMTIGAWTCAAAGGATCPANGSGNLALTNLALPYGGSLTFTVPATIAALVDGDTITNIASVSSVVSDPTAGNNQASDDDAIVLPAGPVAHDDAMNTPFETAIVQTAPGVLANDTGSAISVTGHTSPLHGALTIAPNGAFTYSPAARYSGADTFNYTIADQYGRTSTATVDITVADPAAIDGFVWFDRNRDGVRDDNEPMLAGVTVDLSFASAASSAAQAHAASVGSAGPFQTTRTNGSGQFRFDDVSPGSYVVTGSVSNTTGLLPTWDSDGLSDWIVHVTVTSGVAHAEMAARGRAAIEGTVVDQSTGAPIASADVTCTWAGLDGVFGTPDDSPFVVTADAGGKFELPDVPYGTYRCTAVDPKTGHHATLDGTVHDPNTVHVVLPVPNTTPTMTPTPTTPGPHPRLPFTGANDDALWRWALLMVLLGAALLSISRRCVEGRAKTS
jgi:uncharacterized repeat protein (TIGR01451 family)